MFSVELKRRNCPARCASAASAIRKDVRILNGMSFLLNDLFSDKICCLYIVIFRSVSLWFMLFVLI
jgi:hypothetical protein